MEIISIAQSGSTLKKSKMFLWYEDNLNLNNEDIHDDDMKMIEILFSGDVRISRILL